MRHILIILISILLLSSTLFGQSERPETIIIPVSSLGDVSEVRKQILQNTLTDELKKYFRIVPQEKYKQVLEQVFEELEYEECNEDTCIMRVQEMLQVENVFNLQIIGEGDDTQLNLKWITLDENKNESELCSGCGTVELNGKVQGLVEKLVGMRKVEPVVVVKKRERGVLFYIKRNGQWQWVMEGDEKKDVKYVGEIENGKPNGQGTITIGGYKFFGQWKDGEANGQGTETQSDGSKYVGGWKDAKYHGRGTETFANGDKFVGEYKDGKRNGRFTVTSSDLGNYVGEYEDGKRNGQGALTFSNGIKYIGQWKDGEPNGQGTETQSDGSKYEGEFKNGKPNGLGTFTWPNGDMLMSEFKDGEAHGQGTKIWNDGRNYIGEFKEGGYWTGTLYYNYSGKIPESYVNGIKQ